MDRNMVTFKCLSMMMLTCIRQYLSKFETQFTKMLSNTETELKKRVSSKKACMLLTDPISLFDCLYFLGNMCIPIVYFAEFDVINFEINLIFLMMPFLGPLQNRGSLF